MPVTPEGPNFDRYSQGIRKDEDGNVLEVKTDAHVTADSDLAVQVPEELQGGYRPNPLGVHDEPAPEDDSSKSSSPKSSSKKS